MASALNIYQEFGTSNSNVYIRKKNFVGENPLFITALQMYNFCYSLMKQYSGAIMAFFVKEQLR